MPWIKRKDCNGCGACVEQCPINAITIKNEKAKINMNKCIRCGKCHDVCPQKAVRHDSEKIPSEIKSNVKKARKLMDACAKYLADPTEKQKCLNRMIRYFTMKKIVAEKTIGELELLRK